MLNAAAKILVVDDMASLCEMMKGMLSQLGYNDVTTVNSVDTAKVQMEAAQALGEPFKLVLSDINMPGATGLDFLQWIRAHADLKKTTVVMVSSMGDLDHVMKAAEFGTNGFLVKPVDLETLKARLEKL